MRPVISQRCCLGHGYLSLKAIFAKNIAVTQVNVAFWKRAAFGMRSSFPSLLLSLRGSGHITGDSISLPVTWVVLCSASHQLCRWVQGDPPEIQKVRDERDCTAQSEARWKPRRISAPERCIKSHNSARIDRGHCSRHCRRLVFIEHPKSSSQLLCYCLGLN